MAIRLRIRELRKAKGLTLAQAGDLIGISAAHMSEVERGIKNLNNHLMERLATLYGVHPQELFGSAGQSKNERFSDIMADLAEVDQAKVAGYAEGLRAAAKAKKQTE